MFSIQAVTHTRAIHAALVALAILFAQWAGLVHRHEHSNALEYKGQQSQSEQLLHDCLAFDALTTVQTPVAHPGIGFSAPQLALIGKVIPSAAGQKASNAPGLTRVRDPPALI